MSRPSLYIHVGKATHFLQWEVAEFAKHFTLVKSPSPKAILLSFGPDVLEEAAALPARARFAVLFPGFSYNPVRDEAVLARQRELIAESFTQVFINPGPLEIAYAGLDRVSFYPFSVDVSLVDLKGYRTELNTLLHLSNDNPQKDWQRSESIMVKTGLAHEVFPPRDLEVLQREHRRGVRSDRLRRALGQKVPLRLPVGYVDHAAVVAKYQEYDGFVHVARDVRHPEFIDGKYTASLIEAGVTGAILFWHDTWGLGNGLETVFELPQETALAAERLLEIRSSLDVEKHSMQTREEMLDVFSPHHSIAVRAARIKELL